MNGGFYYDKLAVLFFVIVSRSGMSVIEEKSLEGKRCGSRNSIFRALLLERCNCKYLYHRD